MIDINKITSTIIYPVFLSINGWLTFERKVIDGRCMGYLGGNLILNFRAPSLYGPCLMKIMPSHAIDKFRKVVMMVIDVLRTF